MELFKVHTVTDTGGASWGDTKIYDDRAPMLRDVYGWVLEAQAHLEDGGRTTSSRAAWRRWRQWWERDKGRDVSPRVKRVTVYQLIDDAWVELNVTVTEPSVDVEVRETEGGVS